MTIDELKARCDELGDCLEFRTNAKTIHALRYPITKVDGKMVLVRRALYEAAKGPIPEGKWLSPHCGNLKCVEPEHQRELSTKAKNKLGGRRAANSSTRAANVAKTRRAKGLNKITTEMAAQIHASDEPATVLGPRLGVDDSTVTLARRGKTHRDYSNPFAGLGAR